MEYQDYYQTLGVERNATPEVIKKQYRRLARKYHPDVSKEPNAEEMFKRVQEAYEVLKDPEKRKAYDQMGSEWRQGQGFQPPPGWEQHAGFRQAGGASHAGMGPEEFSDFFQSIFGGGFAQHAQGRGTLRRKGQDHHSKLTIRLEDAYHGAEQQLTLQQPVVDPNTGQLQHEARTINVKIPPGILEGQQIRLNGMGGPGLGGGPNGDLYLEVAFAPHRHFRVHGKDISLKLPITPWEAALGAEVEIPTLGGPVKLKIAAGAQSGQKLRLKGRGLPGKPAGDEFALLSIETPRPENDEQRQIYEQMKSSMPFNPRKALF